MSAKLFESALGMAAPWSVPAVEFDEAAKCLMVVDFKPHTRFAVSGHVGKHRVHGTVTKTNRHLNVFQHECRVQVRTPRVRSPHGPVRLTEPDFAGRLNGCTLLFDALVLMLMRKTLEYWCMCVMRSTVEPMKEVASLVRNHLEGIVA